MTHFAGRKTLGEGAQLSDLMSARKRVRRGPYVVAYSAPSFGPDF